MWYRHRIKESPRPSDPYRAYMIDLSLNAGKPKKIEAWQKEPNRHDISKIDTPMFATGSEFPIFSPAPKPRGRREGRKPQRKGVTYAVPESKPTHQKEIVHLIETSVMKYNTAAPQIVIEKGRSVTSNRNFFSPARNPYTGKIHGGLINVQGEGRRGTTIAIAAHETGHFIHANASPEVLKAEGHNVQYRVKSERRGGSAETFAIERTATKIGASLPAMQKLPKQEKAAGLWALRMYSETYRRQASVSRDPTDPKSQRMTFGERFFSVAEEKKWLGK